jgi:hypothetical protein
MHRPYKRYNTSYGERICLNHSPISRVNILKILGH